MSTHVEINITRGDPATDGTHTAIEIDNPQQIEAVLTAATLLLTPYGRLLRTRQASLNHLLTMLLDVSREPDPVNLAAVKVSGRHTP